MTRRLPLLLPVAARARATALVQACDHQLARAGLALRLHSDAHGPGKQLSGGGRPLLLERESQTGYGVPQTWMEAGLHKAGYDITSITIPGTVAVAIGFGSDDAWSVTSGGTDNSGSSSGYLPGRSPPLSPRAALHRAGPARTANWAAAAADLGADHPDTLAAAGDPAVSLRAAGEYQAARELGEDTLANRRRVLGEDHPDTLSSASGLAISLRAVSEHQAARELDEDPLACRRRVLGEVQSGQLLEEQIREADNYARAWELG